MLVFVKTMQTSLRKTFGMPFLAKKKIKVFRDENFNFQKSIFPHAIVSFPNFFAPLIFPADGPR
jgi:hypothetical protein